MVVLRKCRALIYTALVIEVSGTNCLECICGCSALVVPFHGSLEVITEEVSGAGLEEEICLQVFNCGFYHPCHDMVLPESWKSVPVRA